MNTATNDSATLEALIIQELASERRFRELSDLELAKLVRQLEKGPSINPNAAADARWEIARRRAAKN